MTKIKKLLLSSFLLATTISAPVVVASCSLLAKAKQPIPIGQPNNPTKATNPTTTNPETKQTYDPNLFKFDDITFRLQKEDNDAQLKTQSFLDEIKATNQLEKYIPKKDDFYFKPVDIANHWFEYPTLAKASVYINHHEPILTNQQFNPSHLKAMLNTLNNNKHWKTKELMSENNYRRERLFSLELTSTLNQKINYIDNQPDRLGKYHQQPLPPAPKNDNDPNYIPYHEALKERQSQKEFYYIHKWTEEDRWNYYKDGTGPKATMLWYLNRVIFGSNEWNKKFNESSHNSELFLSKLFYEKTLTQEQLKHWDMDFIMFNFMNQSSLLMSSGEQYDLYKAYLEYLVLLGDLNLHQIQEQQTNGKKTSKEEQYNAKLLTTITKLRELEQLSLKTLQANHILGFSAASTAKPNLQLFAGNTTLKHPSNLRAFYQWTANLYNHFIQPLLHKLQIPVSHIDASFKSTFEPNDKAKKIFNFIWQNLQHTEQSNVILPKVITDNNQLEADYSKILNKLLNPTT